MKKGQSGLAVTGLVMLLLIMFMALGYILNIAHQIEEKDKCKLYNEDYKIMTEITGNFGSWDGSYHCLILMEDGSKVRINDFELVSIKTPMKSS